MSNLQAHLGNIKSLLLVLLGPLLAAWADAQCFTDMRLPKAIQSNTAPSANWAEAITASDTLNALFVGGAVTQTAWQVGGAGTALVGRISLAIQMWEWQKQYWEASAGGLESVVALALNSDETKLVCYGYTATPLNDNSANGFLWTVSPDTGSSLSGLLKLTMESGYRVQSSGLVAVQDQVFLAMNHLNSNAPTPEQEFRVAEWNSSSNTLTSFLKGSGYYGVSGSLAYSALTNADRIFIGGSVRSASSSRWDLAVLSMELTDSATHDLSLLQYDVDAAGTCGDQTYMGYGDAGTAPYISHLGLYRRGANNHYLFGATSNNNHSGTQSGLKTLVFVALLDSSEQAVSTTAGDYHIAELDSTDFGAASRIVGMRPSLERVGTDDYLHLIFVKDATSVYYLTISPSDITSGSAQKISTTDTTLAFGAVWAGNGLGTLGASSYPVKQAYYAASLSQYTSFYGGAQDFTQPTFMAIPVIEDTDNCLRFDDQSLAITMTVPSCVGALSGVTHSFASVTSHTVDTSLGLNSQSLDITYLEVETECSSPPTVTTWTPNPNNPIKTQCYNNAALQSLAFIPPAIGDPVGCGDEQILFTSGLAASSVDSPWPQNFQFNAAGSSLEWGTSDNIADSQPLAFQSGSYTVEVKAWLEGSTAYQSVTAVEVEFVFDCCSDPTLITALPTTSQAAYDQTVNAVATTISLTGSWVSDSSCCNPVAASVTIAPPPPAGLFTIAADFSSVTVQASSNAEAGQTYTVTTSPDVSSTCQSAVVDVVYTVSILADCTTAVFSIDATNSFFQELPALSKSYIANGLRQSLRWQVSSAVETDVGGVDTCGDISFQFFDIASGSEAPYDTAIFSERSSGANSFLDVTTSDTSLQGTYNFRLKVFYADYPTNVSHKDFNVEITVVCDTVVLSLDESIIQAAPSISFISFVNYSLTQLTWTDAIIVSDLADPSVCGAYTHELTDVTSGSPVALDTDVFPSSDLVSATKTLDVYSTDMLKANDYTLRLTVYLTTYPLVTINKDFVVSLGDYCLPTSLTTQPFAPTALSFVLGRSPETASYAAWTPDPSPCLLDFVMTVIPTPSDPTLILFDEATRTVTVDGSDVFYGGDHVSGSYTPGVYSVEIRAWNDNGVDTGAAITLSVTVVDPCDSASGGSYGQITINTAILSSDPISYTIYDPADVQTFVASPTTVLETETTVTCPAIVFSVTDSLGSTTLDSSLFTFDAAVQTLSTYSADYTRLATPSYALEIVATYEGGSQHTYTSGGSLSFTVQLVDPCLSPISLTDPGQTDPALYYFTGSAPKASFTPIAFVVDPPECPVTYACVSNTGTRTDLCTVSQNSGLTASSIDTATGLFEFWTTELDVGGLLGGFEPGAYTVNLSGTSGDKTTTMSFVLTLVDPCPTLASLSISTPIFSGTLEHRLRDPAVVFAWDLATVASISGVVVYCGPLAVAFFAADGLETPLDAVVFTDGRSPEEFSINYSTDSLVAGSYSLSYKVYLTDYPAVEQEVSSPLSLEIVDPCEAPILTLTPSSPSDELYFIYDSAKVISVAAFTANESWCSISYALTTSDAAVLAAITFDPVALTVTVEYSVDTSLSGTTQQDYTITVTGTSSTVSGSASFNLQMINPCGNPATSSILVPVSPLNGLEYYLGSEEQEIDIQVYSSPDSGTSPGFSPSATQCGGLSFNASLVLTASNGATQTIALSESSSPVSITAAGVVKFSTADDTYSGTHTIHIGAAMADFPTVVTLSDTLLPLTIRNCDVVVSGWETQDIRVGPMTEVVLQFEDPLYSFVTVSTCQYTWQSYEFSLAISGEEAEALSQTVELDSSTRTLTFPAYSTYSELVVQFQITAFLSNGVTQVTTSFEVTFEALTQDVAPQIANTAPFFEQALSETYSRVVQAGGASEIEPVLLGPVLDAEGDTVSIQFACVTCMPEEEVLFTLDEETNELRLSPQTKLGSYFFEVTLTDDSLASPSTLYTFWVELSEPEPEPEPEDVVEKTEEVVFEIVVPEITVTEPEVEIVESEPKEPPSFSITDFSYLGLLTIQFSQDLLVVEDISQINQEVLELTLTPDEESLDEDGLFEDSGNLDFSWKVKSFTSRTMMIQVDFAAPVYVSAGISRDIFSVTVLNETYFYSASSQQYVATGSQVETKAPKMMYNTEFTKTFVGVSDSFGGFTNVSMVGNFTLNILLSGAMNLLWGLLHALQIVAHFPLINVMLPGNAQQVFQVIISVATFDVIPTEDLISDAEANIGLEVNEYQMPDNFVDFGYESTDPVRNLQIMFIFMSCMLILPILMLFSQGLFACCQCCKTCQRSLNRHLFWNLYIRFFMEAFLEFAIASLVRFKAFSAETPSETFYSIYSMLILTLILFFTVFVGVFPQLKFASLNTAGWRQKFGSLTLGLRVKDRLSVGYPLVFTLRRLIYALLVIFFIDRSYFQIQFMIFKCSLSMLYSGYFRPFQTPFANTIDLVNETLTLICSYSLIMFSAFVPDAATRYLCGWQLIGLIFVIIAFNLSIILKQGIKLAIQSCKRKYRMRKLRKEMAANKAKARKSQMGIKSAALPPAFTPADFGKFADISDIEQDDHLHQPIEIKLAKNVSAQTQKIQLGDPAQLFKDLQGSSPGNQSSPPSSSANAQSHADSASYYSQSNSSSELEISSRSSVNRHESPSFLIEENGEATSADQVLQLKPYTAASPESLKLNDNRAMQVEMLDSGAIKFKLDIV